MLRKGLVDYAYLFAFTIFSELSRLSQRHPTLTLLLKKRTRNDHEA